MFAKAYREKRHKRRGVAAPPFTVWKRNEKEADSMEQRPISQAIIKRLPRYYRYLGELIAQGVERISSNEFSKLMGVTASQIRQDLNNFGGFGQQGYGYNVKNLYEEIGKILGIDRVHNIVIVGAGNFGRALAGYSDFERRGFRIKALFDRDPAKLGHEFNGIEVHPMHEIKPYIEENNIEIVALTVPKEAAIKIAQSLVDTGVKGFWNFAHTDLKVPKDIVVENVHLSESLMRLSYNIVHRDKMVR